MVELTFLSRNDAIRPKFLGCCMNLWEEQGERETRPRGASQLGGRRTPGCLPSLLAQLGGTAPLGAIKPRGVWEGRADRGVGEGVPWSESLVLAPLKIYLFVLLEAASRKNEDITSSSLVGFPPL